MKYFGTAENIRYFFENPNEDYKIYKIDQQYQSFSNNILLPLDEYLEKIRRGLIKLMIKNYEVELNVNLVFASKSNPNDGCNVFIKTPDWIKNKKCSINPQNKDNKCFQYSITISLYHKEIKNNPGIISKIKSFINNLNWENINFLPEEQDYKTIEMNNKSIALNILQVNEQKMRHFYKSEFNKTRKKQVILLMINYDEKQHYLAVKKLNALLKK